MGWKPDGTVERITDDGLTGNVWTQDKNNGTKIIAERHDTHDSDLAGAIEDTLNLDGLNAMRASLDMGTNTIVNLAAAGSNTDAARFGDVLDTAAFNNTTRDLTLTAKDGTTVATVNIPAAASGGDGTVTEVTAGTGLVTSPSGGITASGSISLDTVGAGANTYNNVVNSLTVDAYGRVTAVGTTTIDGSTNLGHTTNATSVTITSDSGNNTTIGAATGANAGILTAADKTKLDDAITGLNLSFTRNSTSVTVTNTEGNNATLPAASGSLAGVMTAADKSKLDGLSGDGTDISTVVFTTSVGINSSTGSGDTIPAATTSGAGVMTGSDKTKLNDAITGVDLGITRDEDSVTVTNTQGDNADIPMWTPANPNAGVFSGDVTGTEPTGVGSKPSGFVWMVF